MSDFAFTRVRSIEIHNSEALASIYTTFNAHISDKWSIFSIYEKWIKVGVSASFQFTLAAISLLTLLEYLRTNIKRFIDKIIIIDCLEPPLTQC